MRIDVPVLISVEANTEYTADCHIMAFLRKSMAAFGIEEKVIEWSFNEDWINAEQAATKGSDI